MIVAAAVLLLIWGSYTASRMDVDVFPDLTAPTVVVLTESHGMAPEEVEKLVSFPIESALDGATDVRRVRSSSSAIYPPKAPWTRCWRKSRATIPACAPKSNGWKPPPRNFKRGFGSTIHKLVTIG